MYLFLRRYISEWPAGLVMALWYASLFILVAYFALEPQAEFNYLSL